MRRTWHTRNACTGDRASLSTTQKALGKSPYNPVVAAIGKRERQARAGEQHVRIVSIDERPRRVCRKRTHDGSRRRREHDVGRISLEEALPAVAGVVEIDVLDEELRREGGLVAAVQADLDAGVELPRD